MKNLILSLFVSLFTLMSFSQTTLDVYVINPNNCQHTIVSNWISPLNSGMVNILSVDTLNNQQVWHLEITDTTNQISLTLCAAPTPPCNCPMECMGPITVTPNMVITLILCSNTINVDELNVLTIENPMEGVIVFPLSEPTNFYLINSEGKIIKWLKNTTLVSFNSEDLPSGFYHLILETQTTKTIYNLLK
jgi:hypothetical protein